MKILVKSLMVFLLIFGVYTNASAYNYLQDWNIDTAGNGDSDGAAVIDVWDLINISGIGYAEIYDTNAPADLEGTFSNWGVWKATSSDYAGETFPDLNGDNTNDVELTGIYQFGGDAVLGGDLTFKTGTLSIYLDDLTNENYGTVESGSGYTNPIGDSVYGADDGLLIATFSLISGTGVISESGEITESMDNVNIVYESNFLRAGYWVTADGTDLSTLDPIEWVMGFSNTTAVTGPPQDAIIAELYTEYAVETGANQGPEFSPPEAVYMTNNGEFKLAVVPEPTTFLLFGFSLIGLAGISRRNLQVK